MLTAVLLLIYNLLVAFWIGLAFNKFFTKHLGVNNSFFHPTILVLIGWFVLGVFLQIFHLFHAIDEVAHIIVWSFIVVSLLIYKKSIIKDAIASLHQITTRQHIVVGIGLLIIVLINIVQRKAYGDIADYHLQAIRWAEEYALVPGVGNIRRQLGNNSSWFLLNAFSGFHFLGLRSVYTINAGLVIMVGLFVTPHLKQHFWLRNVVLLGYFAIVATRKYTGAVTNDLIITSSIVLLFSWFTDNMDESVKVKPAFIWMIILSVSLVTYKLSALPMVLFGAGVLYYLIRNKFITLRNILVSSAVLTLVFIPWLITNVIQTGYLLFPATATNWFNVDWQMRPEILKFEVDANLAYARAPKVDTETAYNFTFSQWLPHWVDSLDGFSIFLIAGCLFFLLALFVIVLINKSFQKSFLSKYYLVLVLTIIVALVLWFTHGPAPRFVFGYFIFTIAMGVAVVNSSFLHNLLHNRLRLYSIFIVYLIMGFSIFNWISTTPISTLYQPLPYYEPKLTRFEVSGGSLWVPANNDPCWDAELPCTNQPDSLIQFRGTSLQDGFRIKK